MARQYYKISVWVDDNPEPRCLMEEKSATEQAAQAKARHLMNQHQADLVLVSRNGRIIWESWRNEEVGDV